MSDTKLVVMVGAGGVGKTTSSAALGFALAKQGKRVAVITVDPARRLAQALGLQSLQHEPQEVARWENGGRLSALWLDNKKELDDLVLRHAGSMAQKILNNRLFRIIQTQLGGVEEYLGVERVLAIRDSGDFDVCVLDTPPSRHALDFLDSPQHLLRFFNDGVLRHFIKEENESRKDGGGAWAFVRGIFERGGSQALQTFMRFLGSGFVGELSDLLGAFQPVHKKLVKVAADLQTLVHGPDTRFVLISSLEAYPLQEAKILELELSGRDLPAPSLLLLNKCLPSESLDASALSACLGPAAAERVQAQHEAQLRLRAKLQREARPELVIRELLRYSVTHLDRQQLEHLGEQMLPQGATLV